MPYLPVSEDTAIGHGLKPQSEYFDQVIQRSNGIYECETAQAVVKQEIKCECVNCDKLKLQPISKSIIHPLEKRALHLAIEKVPSCLTVLVLSEFGFVLHKRAMRYGWQLDELPAVV